MVVNHIILRSYHGFTPIFLQVLCLCIGDTDVKCFFYPFYCYWKCFIVCIKKS